MTDTKEVKNYFEVSRVNRLILILICSISSILALQSFSGENGLAYGILVTKATMGASVVAVLVYGLYKFRLIPPYLTAFLLMCCPTFSAFFLLHYQQGAARIFFMFFIGFMMISLYMKKELLFSYAIVLNVSLIVYYILMPESVIGTGPSVTYKEFISRMFMMNTACGGLFFVTQWGEKTILASKAKREEAERLLQQLQVTMEKIENSSQLLNQNVTVCNQNIRSTKEISGQLNESMKEIVLGVEAEVTAIEDIIDLVHNANGKVSKAQENSVSMFEISTVVSNIVDKNALGMQQMQEQMELVKSAIQSSLLTVDDLTGKMGDIDQILTTLKAISAQTNLLALNATIESAKAGEAGKGFAVVASEVKKLADQSKRSVGDIERIIKGVIHSTVLAQEEVQKGNQAVVAEYDMMESVGKSFSEIQGTFKNLNHSIDEAVNAMEQIHQDFRLVDQRIETIAAVTQEHLATTSMATEAVGVQSNRIDTIHHEIEDIYEISCALKEMIVKS
jgi:methyl-accepting chemotaxis protein